MRSPASLCITNAQIISEHKIIRDSWLFVRGGIIQKTGTAGPPRAEKTINARGNYVAAGCIDLHIHGDSARVCREAVAGGTTGFVRSLCAADTASLCAIIERERSASRSGAQRLGYHSEGPFLNPAMAGAQPKRALRQPSLKALDHLLACCGADIKIMTLAPELRCGNALIRRLRESGVVISLGHSQATYEQAMAAIDAGGSLATHMYNRMGPVSSRQPGLVTAALLDDRITVEIIADGIHVHPALIQLLLRVKPLDKVVLVTDSVSAEPGLRKRLSAGVYRLADGTIAGSRLTMLEAIQNAVKFSGISLAQAVAMATLNPARVLGVDDRKGRLKPGYDADLIVFDKKFQCLTTIVGGKVVFSRKI